jgi:putative transposase
LSKTFILVYVLAMTSPEWSSLLNLYQRTVCDGVLQYLQKQAGLRNKRGVYGVQVVLWLMMLQRLQGRGTLASAVQLLIQGGADPLLADCHRVRQKRISCRTGGYCQARQRVPTLLCRQVSQEIVERLREALNKGNRSGQRNVLVVDGSSLELEHDRQLVRRYPPASNQHGRGHWPVLRLLVMHDAATGLALQPCWGPMFGAQAVSEQELAEKAMGSLPTNAVIVGDRNFGIFSMAYAAQQRSLAVVLRLTDVRARKLAGPICQPGEYRVSWKPSRWDGGKRRCWPADAAVEGRLIAARVGRGKSKRWLYLFTTLALKTDAIVELYGRRWNIETDLRSLKRTVRLHHINARSEEMMEKELLMAVSAYNLVRAVMCFAAQRNQMDPRQLSFAHVLNVVDAAWATLIAAPNKQHHDQEFLRVLDLAAQCTLPKRTKRRSYPRRLWRRPPGFGFRKEKTK